MKDPILPIADMADKHKETDTHTTVFMTGGTIDAQPYTGIAPGRINPLKDSLVPKAVAMLVHDNERGKLAQHCAFVPFERPGGGPRDEKGNPIHAKGLKDSQDFTPEDFEVLVNAIKHCPDQSIVVTFGTDAMADKARELQEKLGPIDNKIVLTGAMTPLSHAFNADGHADMSKSDGFANLKKALIEVKKQRQPGVYVVMNNGNDIYGPDELPRLKKDKKNKVFYLEESTVAVPGR